MLDGFKKDVAGQVAPLTERVFIESGLKKSLQDAGTEGKNALENVDELINAIAIYDQQTEQPSLIDYLQQISLFSDIDAYDASNDRVALMTLHAAKGLEFKHVFIVGLEDNLLPHEKSNTENEDDLEEERRLFFVGITRAKMGLYISYARYRTFRGQFLRTIPSPFLFEMGCELSEIHKEDDYSYEDAEETNFALPRFIAGQLVRHKSFGLGRVKEFIDMGEDSIVIIRFNTGQTKSLMAKYADLSYS
jgi:DNA helicase-2/ATP-dependent DNA helicase PcrA